MFNLFNRGTPYPFEREGFRAAHDCARSDVRARSSGAFADSRLATQAASGTSEAGTSVRCYIMLREMLRILLRSRCQTRFLCHEGNHHPA